MTEQAEAPDDSTADTTPPAKGDDVTFTQADVDRIIAERLKRENIKELKAQALELAALKDSAKTENERTADRLAQMEAEATTARSEALRWKVAAKHGINDDDADLFLTGTDEATLTRQAERLSERDSAPKSPRPDPSQGARTGGAATTADQFASSVEGLFTT